jgi:dTDP-4-dehydrorhamnose reductase
LITGASGLLGGHLAVLLSRTHAVQAAVHHSPVPPGLPAVALDLLAPGAIANALDQARPDAVLHCAALADADACERRPDVAERVNVRASAELAQACRARGVRLITLSTDLVFGAGRPPFCEADAAWPQMTYGRTKLASEEAVLGECATAVVLRVALVSGCGFGPRATASEAVAWALQGGRTPRLFSDQFRTPVDAESIADAVRRVLACSVSGRFHLGGPRRVSRFELGLLVAHELGLPADAIEPTRQGDLALLAARPADVSLDSSRARRELGWEPLPLEVGIRASRRTP